ncbi:MAG: oligosaccharide flippase family protein [Desulfuromusa sp.]|nr:oligosaccharide flippase family protein [Desulfuromusa sp.]
MSLVRKNIMANLIGSGWVALISIAFIPLYIHFMGVEAYGLVGFYLTLQAVFAVLDMGLTATVSRELARLSSTGGVTQEMRNLVRTLEFFYWGIALFIMVLVVLLAPWIATQWLNANTLSADTLIVSIMLMGMMIALRMPYGFYGGGLLGLQRQVQLNVIKVVVETLRSGGVVLVLWLVSPTVVAFFQWQLLISALGAVAMAWGLWRSLPRSSSKPLFQLSVFRRLWRFAAGMSVIMLLSAILVQMDKLVLSKMLTLEAFAYYSLASTVAVGLYVIIGALFSSVYPRFTQLLASDESALLKSFYHKSCQMMTVLVMPMAMLISFFSINILQLWTHNAVVAEQTAPILSILVVGTALNGMMNLPFALQLAHGWTRLAIGLNTVAIVILLPSLIIVVEWFGVVGAAAIWLVLNAGYMVFGLALMHRKIFKGELLHWIVADFAIPSLVSFSVVLSFWTLFPEGMGVIGQLVWITLAGFVALLLSALAAPAIRDTVLLRASAWKLVW